MIETSSAPTVMDLPGLDCGLCGVRTCAEFAGRLRTNPKLIERCIHLSSDTTQATTPVMNPLSIIQEPPQQERTPLATTSGWHDTLGREFDFFLEHFPEDPGPREVMLPHNPILTRELNIEVGDILIGRPLGMSCGCPITHCGVVRQVDLRTGVIVWCVTGPLNPRQKGFKDIGYYIAEAYEGLITESRVELRIGMRYYFQPRLCMLQWRHSGLVNFMTRGKGEVQVRLEGLWIG